MSGRGYPRLVPTVYVSRTGSRFHRTSTCARLQSVEEKDLAEVKHPVPCKFCYPDAPRASSVHSRCDVCNQGSARPCKHNGGVPVFMTRTRTKASYFMDAGETYIRYAYVWPEKARHYYKST